jgi:CRP/FNR family transcriptional regulator, anaerobic regulatory protein
MTPDAALANLIGHYPLLAQLAPALCEDLASRLQWVGVPAGAVVFDEQQECSGFPFVAEGSIRVVKAARSGREMVLYRVTPGAACIVTAGCLLGNTRYNARGVAETATTLALLPAAAFDVLLAEEPFRRYVFALFSQRIAALMQRVEEVAFQRLDQRLAALLAQGPPHLQATHQRLADELGSARENVSRILKNFADQGLIALHRERIEVLDRAGLAVRADQAE